MYYNVLEKLPEPRPIHSYSPPHRNHILQIPRSELYNHSFHVLFRYLFQFDSPPYGVPNPKP